MFQSMALIFTLLAVFIFYACNKNQQLIQKILPQKFIILGYIFLIMALVMWTQAMSLISAIFIWLMTIMLLLISIPALSLLKPKVH